MDSKNGKGIIEIANFETVEQCLNISKNKKTCIDKSCWMVHVASGSKHSSPYFFFSNCQNVLPPTSMVSK